MGAAGLLLVLLVPARPFISRETESSGRASSEGPQLGGSSLGAGLGLSGSPACAGALAAPCGGSWQGRWAGNSAEGPAGSTFLDKGVPPPSNGLIVSSMRGRDARDTCSPPPPTNQGHPGFGYGSGGLGAQKKGWPGALSRVPTG